MLKIKVLKDTLRGAVEVRAFILSRDSSASEPSANPRADSSGSFTSGRPEPAGRGPVFSLGLRVHQAILQCAGVMMGLQGFRCSSVKAVLIFPSRQSRLGSCLHKFLVCENRGFRTPPGELRDSTLSRAGPVEWSPSFPAGLLGKALGGSPCRAGAAGLG